jgi:hypothetical protein
MIIAARRLNSERIMARRTPIAGSGIIIAARRPT